MSEQAGVMKHSMAKLVVGAGCTIGAIVAPALAAPGLAAAGTPGTATVCATEEYAWTGSAALAPGETLDTGRTVVAQDGTTLEVIAVDYATDKVAQPVAIRVGETPASDGAIVSGGNIAATNAGTEAVMVMSVAVSVDRCHEVASMVAPAAEQAIIASPAAPAAPIEDLPETGSPSLAFVLLAMFTTGFGGVLVVASRRRNSPA